MDSGYCDDQREEDAPRSSSQPAETARPRTDLELCAPEPSGTVGSLKTKGGNEYTFSSEEWNQPVINLSYVE